MPGRRREEGHHGWEAPKVLLTGVPRGLGPGRMVHTWVAASVSLGSGVYPGAQVSFLRGSGLGLSQARVLVQGRLRELVLWKNCFSKDWEKAVISGCLSLLSSLEFPISGREKKKKKAFEVHRASISPKKQAAC